MIVLINDLHYVGIGQRGYVRIFWKTNVSLSKGDKRTPPTLENFQICVFIELSKCSFGNGLSAEANELLGALSRDRERIFFLGNGRKRAIVIDEWSEPAEFHNEGLAIKVAYHLWKPEQLQGIFQRDRFDGELARKSLHLFLFVVGIANLGNRTVPRQTGVDVFPRCRIDTQESLTALTLCRFGCTIDVLFERTIKRPDHFRPVSIASCNLVELFLHVGREVVVHDAVKVLQQEVGDNQTNVGGE